MNAAQLLVQISDLHIGYPDGDPEGSLRVAVQEILKLEPAPAAVLISGDLTHNGLESEYRRLRELLAPLPMPIHPLMGNHDRREPFRQAFSDHAGVQSSPDEIRYVVDCAGLRLICLDTWLPGSDGGQLGELQLAWLADQLAKGVATVVALHHPPIPTGMDEFDRIGLPLSDREALARVLEPAPELVVSGHIHRAIQGRLGSVPVQICPSIFRQVELNLRPGGALRIVEGGTGMAIHIFRPGQPLLTHLHLF